MTLTFLLSLPIIIIDKISIASSYYQDCNNLIAEAYQAGEILWL